MPLRKVLPSSSPAISQAGVRFLDSRSARSAGSYKSDSFNDEGKLRGLHLSLSILSPSPRIPKTKLQFAPCEAVHSDGQTTLAGTSARLLGCRVMLRREFDVSHLPDAESASQALIVEGARQNNLKNISVLIPHNQVTAITGLSGSGKS